MSESFGGNPQDGLQDARRDALGLLTGVMTSDDQSFIKDYLRSVLGDVRDPLRALIELLGGMSGVARILIEMRQEERAIPSGQTLEELGRRIIADPQAN